MSGLYGMSPPPKGLRCRMFGCDWRSVVAGLDGPYRFWGEQCARCGRWYRPGPFLSRATKDLPRD